jgi:hypothetical protein
MRRSPAHSLSTATLTLALIATTQPARAQQDPLEPGGNPSQMLDVLEELFDF